MSVTITRRLEFDYGHRVLDHEGHCKFLHGHHGTVEITVSADELDPLGRVIDFSVVKQLVGGWLNEHLDHNFIANSQDPLVHLHDVAEHSSVFAGREPYILVNRNPTAENLAEEVYHIAQGLLQSKDIKVEKVRFFETPNCWADYSE